MLSTQGRHGHRGGRRDATPSAIARLHVDPLLGFQDFHGRRLAFEAGVDADVVRPVGALLAQALRRVRRRGGDARRGQPADRHRRPRGRARSTRRSRSTATRSSATRTTPRCATRRGEDPQEQMAKERGLTYVKLDGDIGILGNGAGLVMSHARRRRPGAAARPANFLDAGGGSKAEAIVERGRGDPLRPEGQGRAVQHLRRHHALRRGRARADRGVRPDRSRRCRSSCASTAPTTRRAAGCSPRRTLPNVHVETTMDAAAARKVELAAWRGMSILVDKDTKLVRLRASPAARARSTRCNNRELRHQRRRRRHARQGRPGRRGHPGLRHVPRGGRRDRREHGDDLRAAARSPPTRSSRPPTPASRLIIAITEGIPAHDDAARLHAPRSARRRAPDRPQLPGRPLARQGERRHHPRRLLLARATSASSRARAR